MKSVEFLSILFAIFMHGFIAAASTEPSSRFPIKHYIILGGASDHISIQDREKGAPSDFDRELTNTMTFLSNSTGYRLEILFGERTSPYWNKFPGGFAQLRKDFTSSNVDALLREYLAKLNSGEISSPDQIMIHIIDHGSFPKREGSSLFHAISISDDSGQASEFDLSRLRPLIDLAAQKSVLVAVIDSSCFSGWSLALSNRNTCVVTGATDDTEGWDSFTSTLPKFMVQGATLEEAFLSSRSSPLDQTDSYVQGSPQISTSAGISTGRELRSLSYYDVWDKDQWARLLKFYENDPGTEASLRHLEDPRNFAEKARHFGLPDELINSFYKHALANQKAHDDLTQVLIKQDALTNLSSQTLRSTRRLNPEFLSEVRTQRKILDDEEAKARSEFHTINVLINSKMEKLLYSKLYQEHRRSSESPEDPCRRWKF